MNQPLEEWLSGNVVGSRVVATMAAAAASRYEHQGPGTTIRFGIPDLDDMIVMLRGCYYLVAARARTGKSAWLMQVADTAMTQLAETNRVVVIFSAEMDASTLALREACAAEGLSYWRLVQGKLSQDQYQRIHRRLETLGEKRFFLDETSAPSLEHMASQLDALTASGVEIGLICFDYLQLAGEFDKNESQRINKISRGLKSLAKQFDCPVLALGQLNRDIERRKDGQPGLADLAYGGENDPDGVIIIHRPWLLDMTRPKEMVEVWVTKHRHGPSGYCVMAFDEQTMRFHPARLKRTELKLED